MLTNTSRPATQDELHVQEMILVPRPRVLKFMTALDILTGATYWQFLLTSTITGAAAAIALFPKNRTGQFLLLVTCIALFMLGRAYWRRSVQPRLSRPPRDRLHPSSSAPTTVDQWLCIAFKYYLWRVTGDRPTLLALTREGDLLLVQTQELDRWTRSGEPGQLKLGSMCRYETIQDHPISLAFEGTPVPVEELDEQHRAAGVMNVDLSLIRVPRRTFEALARTGEGRD